MNKKMTWVMGSALVASMLAGCGMDDDRETAQRSANDRGVQRTSYERNHNQNDRNRIGNGNDVGDGDLFEGNQGLGNDMNMRNYDTGMFNNDRRDNNFLNTRDNDRDNNFLNTRENDRRDNNFLNTNNRDNNRYDNNMFEDALDNGRNGGENMFQDMNDNNAGNARNNGTTGNVGNNGATGDNLGLDESINKRR